MHIIDKEVPYSSCVSSCLLVLPILVSLSILSFRSKVFVAVLFIIITVLSVFLAFEYII